MMFSIIIPVYNSAKYIRRCLDSIIAQSYQDWECILIDDGSSDDSGAICDSYSVQDSRFKVIHKQNGGASSARNIGIEKSSGEWICFVDSDDWVVPDYLQTFFDIEDKSDITFFAVSQDFANGCSLHRIPNLFKSNDRDEIEAEFALLKHGRIGDVFGWTVDKFYRSSLIKDNNINFVTSLVFREDEIFIMEAGRFAKSISVIDKILYHYCFRDSGITAGGIRIEDYKILSDKLLELLPSYHNEALLCKDFMRVSEYKIKYALLKGAPVTYIKYIKWLYPYFREYPQYIPSGTYRYVAPHSFFSFLLALIIFLPMSFREKHRA